MWSKWSLNPVKYHLFFIKMENDGGDKKSEKLAAEEDTSEADGDVELSASLCSQRSLKNVLTTVGNILEVSCCSLVQMKCYQPLYQQCSNICHNQLWTSY